MTAYLETKAVPTYWSACQQLKGSWVVQLAAYEFRSGEKRNVSYYDKSLLGSA